MRWLVALLLLVSVAYAATGYRFVPSRVLDGDTIEGDVVLWPGLTKHIRIRVYGVDTPEIHTKRACEKKAGYRAKAFVEQWIGEDATLVDVSLGKYAGRALGDLMKDGKRLSDALIENQLAMPYDGGTKSQWQCGEKDD